MMLPFQIGIARLRVFLLLAWLVVGCPRVALPDNICAVCGEQIRGMGYIMTDQVTGEKEEVCSNCVFTLPRCYICGLPIKPGDEVQLPDGRYLCARDAKTVVIGADDAKQVCADVKDDLDRLFSRFTSFPTNVDVAVIDRVDVDSMFQTLGHGFEGPDLLGCIEPVTDNGVKRYHMSLMIGLPLAELKETCAHEYSHAWVGENVPPERHARIERDAEEGFCEMMGYLLMDSQSEEVEKKRVLSNSYTRGQVKLFIEAEQRYGFDDVLDWMRYGVTSRLEADHLDEIRDVKILPSAGTTSYVPPALASGSIESRPLAPASVSVPSILKLQGIMQGNPPVAIINGHSFFLNDVSAVKIGGTNVTIRCVAIQSNSVRIQNVASGKEQELALPAN